jgi:hypothetical protein
MRPALRTGRAVDAALSRKTLDVVINNVATAADVLALLVAPPLETAKQILS